MRACLLSVLFSLLFLAGCGREAGQTRLPAGTPIVLVSIDTLRSDRLPLYGYQEIETPALEDLARDAILFSRAYSHIPLTLPSHVSILTGLLPPEHGVRDNIGYTFEPQDRSYLPAVLKQRGYTTGATVSAYVLRGNTGLASSFDLYEDHIGVVSGRDLGSLQRPGGETLERALSWLEGVAEQPFFLFFHIYEPHSPYEPPEPWASRYRLPYDGEVAAADAVIGRLVAALQGMGIYDRCLLILLSDHGEGLMDHGEQEHEVLLYRELLQVPLLVKLPGGQRGGTRVERPVQLIDVVPTVLDLLGAEKPAGLSGSSLVAETQDGERRAIYSENFYPRLHFGWSELASSIRGRYHLIYGPDPELYDLIADPAERNNLARGERRVFAELRQELSGFDRSLVLPQEVDRETQEKLAALGYLGGTAAPETSGPLPDPKSRLPSLKLLQQALAAASAGRHDEAVTGFRALLEREPQMVDAWDYLGRALHRAGRPDEALEAYERALSLSHGAPHVAIDMASLLLEMGRLEEARTHAELALASHDMAYDVLAQIALKEKSLDEADRLSDEALRRRGTRIAPLVIRARVLVERQRYRQALKLTEQAEEELKALPDREAERGLYLTRGKALASLGDDGGAITAFRHEIELHPEEIAPYTHLALVYALTGRGPEAGRTLRQLVEANPTAAAYAEAIRTLRALGDDRSAAAVLAQARSRWPDDPEL
ncbi:MAG: sulfatase-like hydrolase/transferase, partial [Thermoanaerobaculia bacterium]